MENLNAEFIIKSLEYFIEDECASRTVVHDALALINSQEQRIKELTKEIDSFKQCMEHEHDSFMETFGEYGEKCERLAEENERVKAEKTHLEGRREADIKAFKTLKADTLRNFAERIKRYYKTLNGKTNSNLVAYHIDEVLKEMIGEAK